MANSAQLRRHARESLRGKWKTALLITLGASMVGIISIIVDVIFNWNMFSRLNSMNFTMIKQQQVGELDWTSVILALASFVISPMLWLGLNHFNMQINRGQEAGFSLLFSRRHIWLKGLGQFLMIVLLMIGWYLVFSIPFFLLAFLFHGIPYFLMIVGIIGIFCGIFAIFLRYSMSTYLMSDDPEIGVMESIRESKRMMAGQKGRFFKLLLSFLGWILMAFGIQFVLGHLSYLAEVIVGFCCSIAYQTYMNASIAAFYLDLKGELNL